MSEHPDDFHVLRRRVRLTGTLTTRTGLRIGAGSGGLGDAVDLPVLRDVEGYPIIPGASLKGTLRSTLGSLLRGLAPDPESTEARTMRDAGLWACDPLATDGPRRACGHHRKNERELIDTRAHCTMCRLFGSHLVASHVRISDAMCRDRSGPPPIELRDGVGIDRDLGVVHGGLKYDFQVVASGVAFDLEVFADNVADWQLGLLMTGFDQLAEGFTGLGGFTSRGLGRVDIAWHAMRDFEPGALLSPGGLAAAREEQSVDDAVRDVWRAALAEHSAEVMS